jgi:conjugal transfer/type IV secretion protein DotA/TraY
MKITRNTIHAAAVLSAAFVLLTPLLALAQSQAPTPESFEPTSFDLTGHVIRSIFGDWNNGSVVPVLGEAMRVLNMFALTFGTLMFSYVAVIGTLNTAQDGELLGRKWSSMWVPLRFVFGTAMLVPLASGYSTIQHLILWLALVGGGSASQIWGAALNGFTNPDKAAEIIVNSEDQRNRAKGLMRQVLKAEVCNAVLQSNFAETSTPSNFTMTGPINSPIVTDPVNPGAYYVRGYSFTWGDTSGMSGKSAEACGNLTTSTFTDGGDTQLSFGGTYGTTPQSAAVSTCSATSDIRSSYESISNGQARGIQAAVPILRNLAAQMTAKAAPGGTTPQVTRGQIEAAITQAAAAYSAQASPANNAVAAAATKKLTCFIEGSKEAGWMMASSSFFQMGRIRSAASSALAIQPEFHSRSDTDKAPSSTYVGAGEAPMYEDIEAAENRIADTFKGEANGDEWWRGNFGQWISRRLGYAFSFDPSSSKHALVQIKDTGDVILNTAGGAVTAGITVYVAQSMASNTIIGKAADAVTGFFSGLKALMEVAGPVVYMGFIALFGVGITMAFLIPMLPFMLSIGSILGWLMALFSAMVAAPIWLAGHLHPEGDGFAGKAVGGYMILLETVTRPIFIVFGLIGAFVIIDPMLRFVAWSFQASMQSVQGNSTTGVISIAVFAGMYVSIVWTVCRQSAQLIHSLSEKVYNWIGGQNAGYDQARDFGAAAQQNTGKAAAGVERALQQTSAGAARSAENRRKVLHGQAQSAKSQMDDDVID